MASAYYICCIVSKAVQNTFIVPLGSLSTYMCTILHYLNGSHASKLVNKVYHGRKHYEPEQTAPKEQSDLGPYCLQYRLSKYIST